MKYPFWGIMLTAFMTTTIASCSDDDDPNPNPENGTTTSTYAKLTSQELAYCTAVAEDMRNQCIGLEASWKGKENLSADKQAIYSEAKLDTLIKDGQTGKIINYGELMMSAGEQDNKRYKTLISAYEQILNGASDIADEVGNTKIKDPVTSQNVLDVESWYSWNSITDFADNIRSVQHAYNGCLNNEPVEASVSTYIKSLNPDLDGELQAAITNAIDELEAMPAPFRNHLQESESAKAVEACNILKNKLDEAATLITTTNDSNVNDDDMKEIIKTYVNEVINPTYTPLADASMALYDACAKLKEDYAKDSESKEGLALVQDDIKDACEKWVLARKWWEQSEAFLFDAVEDHNIDPHIDSWPLDKTLLDGVLADNDQVALMAENGCSYPGFVTLGYGLLGFHAVEYVLFRDGAARIVEGNMPETTDAIME